MKYEGHYLVGLQLLTQVGHLYRETSRTASFLFAGVPVYTVIQRTSSKLKKQIKTKLKHPIKSDTAAKR